MTYGGVDVYVHVFLTLALVGGEWSVSGLGRLTPRERALGTHWIGRWVVPRSGLDELEGRKILPLLVLELRLLGCRARSTLTSTVIYNVGLRNLPVPLESSREITGLEDAHTLISFCVTVMGTERMIQLKSVPSLLLFSSRHLYHDTKAKHNFNRCHLA
jgi:hypothetical protein